MCALLLNSQNGFIVGVMVAKAALPWQHYRVFLWMKYFTQETIEKLNSPLNSICEISKCLNLTEDLI